MNSKSEALGQRKTLYKGLQFFGMTFPIEAKVPATFALSPTTKATMNGFLSFDRHEKSYAFQDEAVISLWSKDKPKIQLRAENAEYYRLEVPVPLNTFQNMLELALTRIQFFKEKTNTCFSLKNDIQEVLT